MNTKIFELLRKNIEISFKLPKFQAIVESLNFETTIESLPWTPARFRKFKDHIEEELQFKNLNLNGKIIDVVDNLDKKYLSRFFGEIWKPSTDIYQYSGWKIVEEINKQQPKAVLDVGCGYHPFKGRINNIVGIDPYNDAADYEVDILDYRVQPESHDVIIALGSINFNSQDEIEQRFAHCVNLLKPGGRFFLRANPGIPHKTGPYVDIFPWTFEIVNQFAERYNLTLDTFKKEPTELGRLYFVYTKRQ
jgi:SAM-dependent methyltransferase